MRYPQQGWLAKMIWKIADETDPNAIPEGATLISEAFTVITPDGRQFGCLRSECDDDALFEVVRTFARKTALQTAELIVGTLVVVTAPSS
jgi:hypothetical protein